MFRIDDPRAPTPEPRQATVDEWRVVMAVNDLCVVLRGRPGDRATQRWSEAARAVKGSDFNAVSADRAGPCPFIVQAADRHGNLALKARHHLQHQAFGAARVQAQDDLQDPWRVTCV